MKVIANASFAPFQEDISLSGEHVREGLTCVISVKVLNPEFEGQTKVLYFIQLLGFRLSNREENGQRCFSPPMQLDTIVYILV